MMLDNKNANQMQDVSSRHLVGCPRLQQLMLSHRVFAKPGKVYWNAKTRRSLRIVAISFDVSTRYSACNNPNNSYFTLRK
jgi:hypothetical protein